MFHWPQTKLVGSGVPLSPPGNLETVRGVACLLLVAYHVVGNTVARGLKLPPSSDWHYAMASFDLIRMPLFTILSGFLYGQRRAQLHELQAFALKKLRRLGLPLLVLTVLTVVGRHWVYGESLDLITPLSHSYEHFWFLQALLIIFALIALVDSIWMPSAEVILILALGAAFESSRHSELTTLFSIGSALYLVPYFLFGLLLSQSPEILNNRHTGWLAIVVAAATLWIHQLSLLGYFPEITRNSLVGLGCGVAFCVLMLRFLPRIQILHTVGHYSYSIYLWHVVFAAAGRVAFIAIDISATWILFLGSVVVGLFGPILLHKSVHKLPIISTPILGLSDSRRMTGGGSAAGAQPRTVEAHVRAGGWRRSRPQRKGRAIRRESPHSIN